MRYLLWLSSVVAIAAYLCGPIVDPDLFWHIVTGRWIIANHALPHQDYWSMFGYGTPWRAYSWLLEILLAWIDAAWSFAGLYVFKLLLTILLTGSLAYAAGRLAGDWFFGALLGIVGAAGCFNHLTLRPQLAGWIIFIWLLLASETLRRDGASRKALLPIFLLMALWANLHITTVLGLALVFFWTWSGGNLKIALYGVVAGFLGTLVTPYLGGEWLTFISKTGHPFHYSAIAEFQPASIVQYSTAFPMMLLALLFIFFHLQPRRVEPAKYLFCAALMLGAFAVVKFMPFAVIYTSLLLAYFWGRAGAKSLGNFAEAIHRLRGLVGGIPAQGLTFLLICWAIVSVHSRLKNPLDTSVVPKQAMDFVINKSLPLPLLTGFGSGGYVMYRFSDRDGNLPSSLHRVAIDGRTNVTPADINEKFLKSFYGRMGWEQFVNDVKPESVVWKTESPLTPILLNGGEWCRVFVSGSDVLGFSVLIKRKYLNSGDPRAAGITCLQ